MNNTMNRDNRDTDEMTLQDASIPTPSQEAQPVDHIVIHLYEQEPLEGGEETIVESTPMEGTPIEQGTPPRRKRIKRALLVASIILLIVLIAGGSVAYFLLLPLPVTVTIVPQTRNLDQTDTIIVVTEGPSDGTSDEVPGRILPSITISQIQAAPTTGITTQPATPARGMVTFYNAATSTQTLVAGTLVTAKDGTQVVTDETVTVPAVNYPTLGEASVSAHAVIVGETGNMAAGDIYGPCCLLNISAQSSAFTGGQAASSYQSVAMSDVDNAVSSIETGLNGSVTAAMSAQVRTGEALITPPNCQSQTSTDVPVGGRATQVQVSLSETCTGVVYSESAMNRVVTQEQSSIAHYRVTGEPVITIKRTVEGERPGTYTLSVQAVTSFVYTFSSSDLATLASHLAGKSPKDATQFLLHTIGVQSVSIGTNNPLPSDPAKIHFLFLLQG